MNSKSLILLGDSPLPPFPGGDEKKGDEATEPCESFDILAENIGDEGVLGVLGVLGKPENRGFLDCVAELEELGGYVFSKTGFRGVVSPIFV